MRASLEYVVLTGIALAGAWLLAAQVAGSVSASLERSADLVASAGR